MREIDFDKIKPISDEVELWLQDQIVPELPPKFIDQLYEQGEEILNSRFPNYAKFHEILHDKLEFRRKITRKEYRTFRDTYNTIKHDPIDLIYSMIDVALEAREDRQKWFAPEAVLDKLATILIKSKRIEDSSKKKSSSNNGMEPLF